MLIEVWRPGGRSDERRPHQDRNRQRHQGRPQGDAQPAAAAGEGGEGAPRGEQRHRRGRRNNEFRKPREGAPADGAVAAAPAEGAPAATAEARPERPRFENRGRDRDKGGGDRPDRKFGGGGDRNKGGGDRNKGGGDRGPRDNKGRDFGGRDKGGRDKGGPSHRQWATTAAPRDRDRPADPNSPFAKLAALKEQLAGGNKE